MNLENETMAPLQIVAQVCGGKVWVHGGEEREGVGTWREGGGEGVF